MELAFVCLLIFYIFCNFYIYNEFNLSFVNKGENFKSKYVKYYLFMYVINLTLIFLNNTFLFENLSDIYRHVIVKLKKDSRCFIHVKGREKKTTKGVFLGAVTMFIF